MNADSQKDLVELAESVIDFFWKAPPVDDVDHSARKAASNLILNTVALETHGLTRDSARAKIMTLLKEGTVFSESVESSLTLAITRFKKHYTQYGGKQALFAYCLLRSLGTDENTNLFKSKASLLNWYSEDRRIDHISVDGGEVNAWWPFDWFVANFRVIADTVISSVMLETAKVMISELVQPFLTSYHPVKESFSPYPQAVLQGKSPDQSVEDFTKSLEEQGLIEQYLYLFKLNDEEIGELVREWTDAFLDFRKSLNLTEVHLLVKMLGGPIEWSDKRKDADNLRVQRIVRLVEPRPGKLWLVLYPEILEDNRK